MQKKLIALAIAGLAAAPVFAQSNVTVYGVADLTFESVKASGSTTARADDSTRLNRTRLQSNSSYLGFKGVEDLGNGLKALFQIETTVTADTGGFGGGRDTFVALNGGFGTVVLGNLTHPVRAMGAKTDLNPGATGIGFVGATYETLEVPGGKALRTGTGDRQQLVAYVSPSIMGLTGTIAYGPGESATPSVSGPSAPPGSAELKPYMWQAAVQYENGPIYAGLAYHQARDFSFVDTNQDSKHSVIRAAGKYTLGTGTTLSGLWDRQKVKIDGFGTTAGAEVRRDAWALNVGQAIGAHNVHAGYSQSNKLKGGVCGGTPNLCDDTKTRMWTVGYEYSLSKRTMIKAVYANIKNQANASADFYTAAVSNNATVAQSSGLADGADPRGFGIGLRHSF